MHITITAPEKVLQHIVDDTGRIDLSTVMPVPPFPDTPEPEEYDCIDAVIYCASNKATLSADATKAVLCVMLGMDVDCDRLIESVLDKLQGTDDKGLYAAGAQYADNFVRYGTMTLDGWKITKWGMDENNIPVKQENGSISFDTERKMSHLSLEWLKKLSEMFPDCYITESSNGLSFLFKGGGLGVNLQCDSESLITKNDIFRFLENLDFDSVLELNNAIAEKEPGKYHKMEVFSLTSTADTDRLLRHINPDHSFTIGNVFQMLAIALCDGNRETTVSDILERLHSGDSVCIQGYSAFVCSEDGIKKRVEHLFDIGTYTVKDFFDTGLYTPEMVTEINCDSLLRTLSRMMDSDRERFMSIVNSVSEKLGMDFYIEEYSRETFPAFVDRLSEKFGADFAPSIPFVFVHFDINEPFVFVCDKRISTGYRKDVENTLDYIIKKIADSGKISSLYSLIDKP